LSVRPITAIDHLDIYPNVSDRNVRVVVKGGDSNQKLTFLIDGVECQAVSQPDGSYLIDLGDKMKLWDEFHPNLYTLEVKDSKGYTVSSTFGMRDIKVNGMDIILNGKPIYVRGTVGNCCFPETGYPPTDEASWERIFRKCKEYGLNTMRFHSYCPPEAAFRAADKLGFYLQPEGPSWPNHGVRLSRGMAIDQYLMDETKRMVEAYGNHPSFLMMSAGNEPAGDWVKWCNAWVDYWKKTDSRRIYCGANVGGGWAWDNGSQYHVKGGGRGLDWGKHAPHSDDDYSKDILFPRNYKDSIPNNSPIICHEQGQWCAFPDLKERLQYTGAYKAKNFDIFEDLLRDNGMASQAEKFLMASGKLQTLAYKYEMERNLRTKDYTGFVLLGLNDYSGQGTALVGPLNVHWKEKGYVDASEWTEFCNDVVPLAKFPKFVYSSSDTLEVPIEVYNASSGKIVKPNVEYTIKDGDDIIMQTSSPRIFDIPHGKNNSLCTVSFPLSQFSSPKKYTFEVAISSEGRRWQNHWDFWVYPGEGGKSKEERVKSNVDRKDIYVADSLDAEAIATLKAGGKVLLTAAGKVRYGNDIKQQYLPVFWNTSWFKMRPPHVTGAYIDSKHPVYRDFPTDDWTNLNWWELVNRAQVMNLSEFPKDYQPPMQPIDTWHVSRKCGMIVEANVLGGRLLMTTIDISSRLDTRLVARQLRKSIINYMNSEDFKPTITVDESIIRNLYENEAKQVNMFTKDSPDELKPKIK
ncbi:MAG: glycoside hydrolase family 2 TIM barrel-domain containing protein, partial [Prevotellaceae bacterium]|nr:glycoside hydrolase family 2 TIM barrel-domain containing protein [Prevotellaceae bacterium]